MVPIMFLISSYEDPSKFSLIPAFQVDLGSWLILLIMGVAKLLKLKFAETASTSNARTRYLISILKQDSLDL